MRADFDDDVALLEPLDDAVHDFADALVVFGEDDLALGLAHLLEDHLLGGLRGDAAEDVGALRELDLIADFDFGVGAVHVLGFGKRDLGRGVGHLVDDGLDGEELDLAVLRVELGAQVFGALVVLARRGEDGFFHRLDDDIGLDALFPSRALRSSAVADCCSSCSSELHL